MKFDYIAIGKDIIVLNALAFEFTFAPNFRKLQLVSKILMQHHRRIFNGTTDG
jgi:hypothetical protein